YEFGVLFHRLTEGTEDDAFAGENVLVRGRDGYTIEYGIDRNAGEAFLFVERDAQLFEGPQQLGVHFVHALESGLFLRGGVVALALIVHGRVRNVRPMMGL